MSDSPPARRRRSRDADVDISTQAAEPSLGWGAIFLIWLVAATVLVGLFTLSVVFDISIWWGVAGIAALLALAWLIVVVWVSTIKYGTWTFMRTAQRPAELMAAGDSAGAEAACAAALERARQFDPDDLRRAMMLLEIAMYVKNQGRYPEMLALYDECVTILEKHVVAEPLIYFLALNNYGICFIHLRDFATAQKILEKALDLTLATRSHEADSLQRTPLERVHLFQLVLHLNLAFLFMEMRELKEAESHLREADAIVPLLAKNALKGWYDHYVGICALWEFEAGNFAEVEIVLAQADNPDYYVHLRVRARLCLVQQEYAQAEKLTRQFQDLERKKGTLHRPELLKMTLDFAECLFGQGKHEEAWSAFQEARSIVADFGLPTDRVWRSALETWLRRARELGKTEVAALMENELQRAPANVDGQIMILEKLRARREAPG
ncbi:MAG: hypothetical protein HYR84_03065 [Planctomycetes bacterium]|nr:hypothetical protein [Planctomycetota bacterium]